MRKQQLQFQQGPSLFGWQLDRCDTYRVVRLRKPEAEQLLLLSPSEYLLFWLLVEQLLEQARELSYQTIASHIYGCTLDHDLLLLIRKRMTGLRKQLAASHLDIVSIPHYGYELRPLQETIPYRYGPRAKASALVSRLHRSPGACPYDGSASCAFPAPSGFSPKNQVE
jgi:hypothetical protein